VIVLAHRLVAVYRSVRSDSVWRMMISGFFGERFTVLL